jgi:hypothetical protein
MNFVWTMHSFVYINYAFSWFVYMCKFMCFMQFYGQNM